MNAINFEAKKLGLTVDALGKLKAKIARLKKEEKELEAILKTSGTDVVEGKTFRCTISNYVRTTINFKAICEKLGASDYFIKKYSKDTAAVKVLVKAHKK